MLKAVLHLVAILADLARIFLKRREVKSVEETLGKPGSEGYSEAAQKAAERAAEAKFTAPR